MSGINIYTGGKTQTSTKRPVVSSAATRAAATTSALGGGAVASDDGSTAVQPQGILGKVKNIVGGVAQTLQHLPGPIGTIAGLVSRFVKPSSNDPEWWNTIPGDGLSTNEPLTITQYAAQLGGDDFDIRYFKAAILEIISADKSPVLIGTTGEQPTVVIKPDDRQITQYVIPAVRKVTNAVYLQSATAYGEVFSYQATIYAIWRNLQKFDYFLKHGNAYTPSLNDAMFPLFTPENAAWLQSTITRLEEYLHSNVRLPHTLCEYLTWRFMKIFRSNTSGKSAFVMYDIISPTMLTTQVDSLINSLMTACSNSEEHQKAVADLYNAYYEHDQDVVITDAMCMGYDAKEFMLRTNMDMDAQTQGGSGVVEPNDHHIIMDSDLDNPTVFMASTVSCRSLDDTLSENPQSALFPVWYAIGYVHGPQFYSLLREGTNRPMLFIKPGIDRAEVSHFDYDAINNIVEPVRHLGTANHTAGTMAPSTQWFNYVFHDLVQAGSKTAVMSPTDAAAFILASMMASTFDFYNCEAIFSTWNSYSYDMTSTTTVIAPTDLTPISIDSGLVPNVVIKNEQVLAFANLVYEGHRDKTTYKMVEKRVAKDLANTIAATPVALTNTTTTAVQQ